jgi:hypothetical protein
MAACRHTVVDRLRWAGYTHLAVVCRRCAAQPALALDHSGIAVENCMALGIQALASGYGNELALPESDATQLSLPSVPVVSPGAIRVPIGPLYQDAWPPIHHRWWGHDHRRSCHNHRCRVYDDWRWSHDHRGRCNHNRGRVDWNAKANGDMDSSMRRQREGQGSPRQACQYTKYP